MKAARGVLMPLHDRLGQVVAHTTIDAADALLVGELIWTLNANGYAWRSNAAHATPRHLYLHRVLMGCVPGDGMHVDHINRNRLDNRRCNLRLVTPAEGRQNTSALGGISRYRGVTYDRSRGQWVAAHQLDGRHRHIGRFTTEAEAAQAASAWRKEHMPFSVEDAA